MAWEAAIKKKQNREGRMCVAWILSQKRPDGERLARWKT